MFCSNCGRKLSDDAKFCDGCGQAVISANPSAGAAGTQRPLDPAKSGAIPTQTLPGAAPAQTLPGTNVQGGPPPPGMPMAPPRKKKHGCLIAFIIAAVLVLIAAGGFLLWLLGDIPLFDKAGGIGETDGTVQGVDIADLMMPADMRGAGMPGYWVMEGYSDQQGNMIEKAEDAMILYLGEDGTCILRHDDRSNIDETAGQWQDDVMVLHDENEDMDFELGISLVNGNLYMDMGEEDLLMCFRGPYTEDALLYQCTEYFKAASFMTSSLMESSKEMDLTYAQWDYGMTQTVDYWDALLHTASALKMAADRYLAMVDEEAQARGNDDWLDGVLDFLKPMDVYGASYTAEEVNAVLDRAAQGQKIKTLARHFDVTAEQAADIVYRTQLEVSEQAYKDEMFYGRCETACRMIKTGSKVGVFICGTITSGGTTGVLSAGEGAAFFIQGADIAMEINEESAYIAYEINGKQSAKKTLEGIRNIRSVTAPAASIVGLKGLNGTGFDKFMVLNDALFDAKDGKVLAIQVVDSSTGKMEVAHVTPEQLAQWKQDKGAEPTNLIEQDKEDVWAEIWAKVDELEEQERLEAGGPPTPDATVEPTEEPAEASEEPPVEEDTGGAMHGWEGEWVLSRYYLSYEGEWKSVEDLAYNEDWDTVFTFNSNGTVDIESILADGEIVYQSTGREGHWGGNVFHIDARPDNSATNFSGEMDCVKDGDSIIVEFLGLSYEFKYELVRR